MTLARDSIRAALACIPAHDRDLWVRMGMAIKSELGEDGFDLWDQWSQQDESYNERDALSAWRSFKANGEITIATLFYEAQQRGFRINGHEGSHSASNGGNHAREGEQADDADEHCKHDEVRERAKAILGAANGDPSTHPYWIKKRINLGPHIRRGRWPQRDWPDALLIPIYQADGQILSIEAIDVDGIRDSSGADIVILADNDIQADGKANTGLDAAIKAARAVGGRVAIPELGARKCDFWDLWRARCRSRESRDSDRQLATDASASHEWPEPKPIPAALHPVPAFDADTLLPEALRGWIMDEADRMPCAPDFIAAGAMVALGAIIGARCAIKPKAKDDWLVIPNPWGGIVALRAQTVFSENSPSKR